MSEMIEYASGSTKEPRRILWLGYVLLVFPAVLAVLLWVWGSFAANYIVDHFARSVVGPWFHLGQNRIDEMAGNLALVGGGLVFGLAIASRVAAAQRWLRSRVPLWYLMIPVYVWAVGY